MVNKLAYFEPFLCFLYNVIVNERHFDRKYLKFLFLIQKLTIIQLNRVSAKFHVALLRGMNDEATVCTIRGVITSPRLLLELILVTCSEVVKK